MKQTPIARAAAAALAEPKVLSDGSFATGNSDYDALPRAVKDQHPYDGWLWLSGPEKANLLQSETEPDF